MNTSKSGRANQYPSISIIGAGIAGLSIACHLRRRRIPFSIFDAASQPKGHHYGITIAPWGYRDIVPTVAAESKINIQTFRELTAVDRLVGGSGRLHPSDKDGDQFRASDMALREVLAREHQINWNHKLVSAEQTSDGLKLSFENGEESTANLVIDAGGERSGLLSLLLPDLKPDILPYAVYHGSRYLPNSIFTKAHSDIFAKEQNVRYFPSHAESTAPWALQIARTYVTREQVPSKVKLDDNTSADEPVVELRYTFSRPASQSSSSDTDPLYNPNRSPSAAKTTPEQFFVELSTYLSDSSSSLPPSLSSLLSLDSIRANNDRILNWLMRIEPLARPVHSRDLQTLASHFVIAIGDAVHATPPVASEGASLAMADASHVAEWIEKVCGSGSGGIASTSLTAETIGEFYNERLPTWVRALDGAERRLQDLHLGNETDSAKLSGRI